MYTARSIVVVQCRRHRGRRQLVVIVIERTCAARSKGSCKTSAPNRPNRCNMYATTLTRHCSRELPKRTFQQSPTGSDIHRYLLTYTHLIPWLGILARRNGNILKIDVDTRRTTRFMEKRSSLVQWFISDWGYHKLSHEWRSCAFLLIYVPISNVDCLVLKQERREDFMVLR